MTAAFSDRAVPTSSTGTVPPTATDLLREAWTALEPPGSDGTGSGDPAAGVDFTGPAHTLPSYLPVTALAQATAAAAGLAGAELWAVRTGEAAPPVEVDSRRVAVAFTSERWLRVNGQGFALLDPLSRFLPTADGWVRLHGNYPHHRARLREALGVPADVPDGKLADRVALLLTKRQAVAVERDAAERGALAVAVRTAVEWERHPQGEAVAARPLVEWDDDGELMGRQIPDGATVLGPPPPADVMLPAVGVRVLDLTRVIAGPVATRTLALLGADVLRIDPPGLPELPHQHLDTGFGKRSALLDITTPDGRAVFEALLAEADVLVTGYRPDAVQKLGLDPVRLRQRFPRLVTARLSAWGETAPEWPHRRGFDSLVQAATGIGLIEGGHGDGSAGAAPAGAVPGAMPAQALDHGTGYLMAAAVLRALTARETDGRGRGVAVSLTRTAAWLSGWRTAGTGERAAAAEFEREPYLARRGSAVGELVHALPPFRLAGGVETWASGPEAWGTGVARWGAVELGGGTVDHP